MVTNKDKIAASTVKVKIAASTVKVKINNTTHATPAFFLVPDLCWNKSQEVIARSYCDEILPQLSECTLV